MPYVDEDRWTEFVDAERDEEVEHVAAVELARRERLDEKGGVVPLPKPTKRHRADPNEWLHIRDNIIPRRCRVCDAPWDPDRDDLHHLLPKDGHGTWPGGDDVIPNLIPLCRDDHREVEARDPFARSIIRRNLTQANVDYLKNRIGDRWHVFLERHYSEAA